MKVTVATLSDKVFTLDVSQDLEVENFKAFCEVESGVPSAEIGLLFNGIPLLDLKKSLKEYGVKDGDMIMMDQIRRRPQTQPQSQPPSASPAGMNWDFSRIQIPGSGGGGAGAGAGPRRSSRRPGGRGRLRGSG